MSEEMKYYANIINPYAAILKKKLNEIASFNLPVEIIATSHGIIWRDRPMEIIEKYTEWCSDYQENQVSIIYDTMWNGTKALAEKIAEGISLEKPDLKVKVFNRARCDESDLIVETFKSKMIVIGSPTVGNNMIHGMAGFLNLVKEAKFRNKKAAAFGCYGWSGEAVKIINEMLRSANFEVISDGFRNQWNLDATTEELAIEFGKQIAKEV